MSHPQISLTRAGELVGRPAAGHQPLAPVYRLPLVDRPRRVQEVVEHLVQVPGVGAVRAVRVHVGGGRPLALREQHLRLETGPGRHLHGITVTRAARPPLGRRGRSRSTVRRRTTASANSSGGHHVCCLGESGNSAVATTSPSGQNGGCGGRRQGARRAVEVARAMLPDRTSSSVITKAIVLKSKEMSRGSNLFGNLNFPR